MYYSSQWPLKAISAELNLRLNGIIVIDKIAFWSQYESAIILVVKGLNGCFLRGEKHSEGHVILSVDRCDSDVGIIQISGM